jgi:hypothetical protein
VAPNGTTLTATPNSTTVGEPVTLTWSNLPKGSGLTLVITGPYFSATQVVDFDSGSYQFIPAAEGSYTAEIQQRNKVAASATFTATP